jgi:hypothetical protein
MTVFTRHLNMMLRRTGELWNTTLDSECVSFYGIFDVEDVNNSDSSQRIVKEAQTTLTVETWLARKFVTPSQSITDPRGCKWLVRECFREGDGALSRCVLVEVTE